MLFQPQDGPRVYGQEPGRDLARDLVEGLMARTRDLPPEYLARTEIYVSISSLRSGLVDRFKAHGDCLLPRIRLLNELTSTNELPGLPDLSPRIERRLRLAKLLRSLPTGAAPLPSHGTVMSLAASLETLLDEMDCEGVCCADLTALDMVDLSEHWHNSFTVIQQIDALWDSTAMPGEFGRMLQVIKALEARWDKVPPDHPIIVAGSTGSVGATRRFMKRVARLPQGAVVLPCLDREMPADQWQMIQDVGAADHSQHNIAAFLAALGLERADVPTWLPDGAGNEARQKLVSLMMCPAPDTHRWVHQGPALDLTTATAGLSLIESRSERQEAIAIAIAIREAVQQEKSVALVTPDRRLVRQVCTALSRWSIIPDNRFGLTLDLTQTGSFLIAIARMMDRAPTAVDIITLLEHPLASKPDNRFLHQRLTDLINVELRRRKPVRDLLDQLHRWTARLGDTAMEWVIPWLELFENIEAVGEDHLVTLVDRHQALVTDALAIGNREWSDTDAGTQCQAHLAELRRRAHDYGRMAPADYAEVIKGLLQANRMQAGAASHPGILIWNTEDARMQKPDRIIAGRLNAGIWPPALQPDIWLSHQIRSRLGLSVPEHRVGLSAHDFQHVMALDEVFLTRCIEAGTESTLPSAWLVRLTSLLEGAGHAGQAALAGMQERGRTYLEWAATIDASAGKQQAAPRPSPQPPVHVRPRQLAVTSLPTLIANPYAVYARFILQLQVLDGLTTRPDPRIRGQTLHRIMEGFVRQSRDRPRVEWIALLQEIADGEFANAQAPGHSIMIWKNVFNRIIADIVAFERGPRAGRDIIVETSGEYRIPELDFTLTAKADRIEIDPDDDSCEVYDYKSGGLPGKRTIQSVDVQVPVLMQMAAHGAFTEHPTMSIRNGGLIGIGNRFELMAFQEREIDYESIWMDVLQMLTHFLSPDSGYTAKRYPKLPYGQEYDHLARHDEWRHNPGP